MLLGAAQHSSQDGSMAKPAARNLVIAQKSSMRVLIGHNIIDEILLRVSHGVDKVMSVHVHVFEWNSLCLHLYGSWTVVIPSYYSYGTSHELVEYRMAGIRRDTRCVFRNITFSANTVAREVNL